MTMTREQVLAASKKLKVVEHKIDREGWGVARLRELSAGQMFAFRREMKDRDDEEMGLELLARCWIGEDDERLFAGEGALAELQELPIDVLTQLTTAVMEANGAGQQAVEAAEKN